METRSAVVFAPALLAIRRFDSRKMSMSEVTLLEALQTTIRALDAFTDVDVVINDFSVFDQDTGKAPYAIIGLSDEFRSRQDAPSSEDHWAPTVTLVERYTDWKTTLDNLVTRRQAIIDAMNSGSARSAGGLAGYDIHEVRSGSPVLPRYPEYTENTAEADPIFLYQDIIIDCTEF